MNYRYLLFLALCVGCSHKTPSSNEPVVTSLQIIDRNGFSETISTKDRLALYKNVDFLAPQSYEKVLRVYGKDGAGKSLSKITSYHSNGQIQQYLELVDGRAHGMYREWHSNGVLKLEVSVIEGMGDINDLAQASWLFNGQSTVWNEQGEKIADIFYDKGALCQTATYYHPNGAVHKTIPYEHGEIHGCVFSFDAQGTLLEQKNYAKGAEHGPALGKWSDQLVSFQEEYDQGKLMTASYYDQSGRLVGEIKNGQGVQPAFKEGVLYSTIEYQNGIPEGMIKFYSPSGNLLLSYSLFDGMKRGEEIHYYSAHPKQPKLSLFWHDDLLQGMVTTWYENGKMESQREMSANAKKGMAFAWYEQGDLMLIEEYEENTLVKGSYFKKGHKEPVTTVEKGDGFATLYDSAGHFLKKIEYEKGKPK